MRRSSEESTRTAKAYRTANTCVECAKPIDGDEVVYRIRTNLGGSKHSAHEIVVMPCCEGCGSRYFRVGDLTSCEACGRPMYQVSPYTGWHNFCCGDCANKIYRRNAKARQARKRKRTCPICGEEFTPLRSDAKTCSSTCRQKSYRQRARASPLLKPPAACHASSASHTPSRRVSPMFIRKKEVKGCDYYSIVRSVREGARVRQVIVASLGPCDTVDGALRYYRRELADYQRRAKRLERIDYATHRRAYAAATHQIGRITATIERIKAAKSAMRQP